MGCSNSKKENNHQKYSAELQAKPGVTDIPKEAIVSAIAQEPDVAPVVNANVAAPQPEIDNTAGHGVNPFGNPNEPIRTSQVVAVDPANNQPIMMLPLNSKIGEHSAGSAIQNQQPPVSMLSAMKPKDLVSSSQVGEMRKFKWPEIVSEEGFNETMEVINIHPVEVILN